MGGDIQYWLNGWVKHTHQRTVFIDEGTLCIDEWALFIDE